MRSSRTGRSRAVWRRSAVTWPTGAARAGRPAPRLVAYVRVAVGENAEGRLREEMDRYRRSGAHYARAFDAQPGELVGVAEADPDHLPGSLDPYREAVDTLVVRGLPAEDAISGWLDVARAAQG